MVEGGVRTQEARGLMRSCGPTRLRMREDTREDTDDGEAAKENDDALAKMIVIMGDVKASLEKNNECLACAAENEGKQTMRQGCKQSYYEYPSYSEPSHRHRNIKMM